MAVNPTLTTTTFNNPPKYLHAGMINVSGSYNSVAGVMGTAGDTLFLCKVPHGATILDFSEDHSTGATTAVYSAGLTTGCNAGGAATLSLLISAGIQATVNRRSVNGTSGGYQVSVSDSDPNRYGILSMSNSGGATATTSLIVNWNLVYKMDI